MYFNECVYNDKTKQRLVGFLYKYHTQYKLVRLYCMQGLYLPLRSSASELTLKFLFAFDQHFKDDELNVFVHKRSKTLQMLSDVITRHSEMMLYIVVHNANCLAAAKVCYDSCDYYRRKLSQIPFHLNPLVVPVPAPAPDPVAAEDLPFPVTHSPVTHNRRVRFEEGTRQDDDVDENDDDVPIAKIVQLYKRPDFRRRANIKKTRAPPKRPYHTIMIQDMSTGDGPICSRSPPSPVRGPPQSPVYEPPQDFKPPQDVSSTY